MSRQQIRQNRCHAVVMERRLGYYYNPFTTPACGLRWRLPRFRAGIGTHVASRVRIALRRKVSVQRSEGVMMAIRSGLFGKGEEKPEDKGRGFGSGPYNVNPAPARPMPASEPPATAANAPKARETTSTNTEGMKMDEAQGSKLIVGPNIKLKGVEITDC